MSFLKKLFGRPTRDDFARLMIQAFRKHGVQEVEYDPEAFRLSFGDHRVNLHNVYDEAISVPRGARGEAIERFVRGMLESGTTPMSLEEAAGNLQPWVKERFSIEVVKLLNRIDGRPGPNPAHRVLAERLVVMLADDRPDSIASVGEESLEEWGVSFEDALGTALGNLRKVSTEPFSQLAPGVFASPWHDNYDLSRMLLQDVIHRCRVKGDPVALLPNRDVLLITGSRDSEGLAGAAQVAKRVMQEQPRPATGYAFRLEADGWQPFMPEPDRPELAPFHELAVISHAQDCNQQRELLDRLHETRGDDIYVPVTNAIVPPEGGLPLTVTLWVAVDESWLPRADKVQLLSGDPQSPTHHGWADWERVVAVMGDQMTPLGMYPERYQVRGFPTDEELRAIGPTPLK